MKPQCCLALIFFLVTASSALEAQELLITEVLADNAKTVTDEDGDFEDWVELFNAGDADVNLDGYYLTDKADKPTAWRFPAVTMGPRRFLVLFCSGKDRRDPALELHTNFKIDNDGEILHLVAPDGKTVVSKYDVFPEQQADMSYGMATDSTFATLLAAGAPARAFIPTNGDLATRWTQNDFDDTGWKQGTTAVGFGVRSPELELVGTDITTEMKDVSSSVYIRIPFQVTDPAAVDILTLSMRYDDGFAAYLNGELVATANAPAALAWNSTSLKTHVAREPEEFDISGHVKALRAGSNVLAIHGLNLRLADADCFMLPGLTSVDVGKIQPTVLWYFPTPTPGGPNGPGFLDAAPRPIFSLGSATYVGAQQVSLSTELAGGEIRYTLDSTVPNESSTLYAAPIDVAGPMRITARVFKTGLAAGIPERNTYVIVDPNAATFTSKLPIVIVTTFGRAIGTNCGGGLYTPGFFTLVTPGNDGKSGLVDEPSISSSASFRRRGSSTCGDPKFSFNVEMEDAEGRDENVKVFDFAKDSDYIMFSPYNFDHALMRNPIAYWMSREVGRWAARTQFVECYYHPGKGAVTASSYVGVYVFMEKNKRNENRVNISQITARDNTEPELSGGYLMRRDRVGPDEIAISAGAYSSLVFVYPKLPTNPQRTYMSQFMTKVFASLNPNVGSQEDNDLIDFTAWIDHHIINWYTKNVDAFRLSGYFHKDRNGPLVMGPVWDFDRTMGCDDDDRAKTPEGWDNDASGDGGTRYFESGGLGSWYSLLFNNRPPQADTPWNAAYKARWRTLRKGPLQTEHITAQIDAWAALLTEAADRNFNKWPATRPRFGSFQGEVDHLKDWLTRRADWIDSQFVEAPHFDPAGGIVARGTQVQIKMTAQAAIHYTLDGSDPKGPDGKPSATALPYTAAISIQANTRVRARALYDDGFWSSLTQDDYYTDIPSLMITEIMYKPAAPTAEEDPEGKFTVTNMEFVEITNVGQAPVTLTSVTFPKGITFTFDGVAVKDLDPGQSVVVPRNKEAFAARYKNPGILVAGEFGGMLTDIGEQISLAGALGEPIFDFKYVGTWYPEANGGGFSIVNKDPLAPATTLGEAARWRPSDAANGSPGSVEGASAGGRILPGDSNRDGTLQVTDSIRMLLLLFGGLTEGPCGAGGLETPGNRAVLDWDGSGTVNITDALLGLQYLFQQGVPHAAGTACVPVNGCETACTR